MGQDRAVASLELGLRLRSPGYHVFVAGPAGTGRRSAVRGMMERFATGLPVPSDLAYVHRFDDPDRPRLLRLPPGAGRRLAERVDALRTALATRAPTLADDPELDRRREALQERYAAAEDELMEALRAELGADGFALVPVAMGPGMVVPEVAPLHEGKPVPLEELREALDATAFADTERRLAGHAARVRDHLRGARGRQRRFVREIQELVRDVGTALVEAALRAIAGDAEGAEVEAFLRDVRADAVDALVELVGPGPGTPEMFARRVDRYRVNVVADRSQLTGAPVVDEGFPTAQNLAGMVERVQDGPLSWRADATTIRGGSLLRADGGFLLLQAADLLQEPGAWPQLKRALKAGVLEPGSAGSGMWGFPRALEPDPITIDVKVVLVGERWAYELLGAADPDFLRLFSVRADFSADMPRDAGAARRYAEVIAGICGDEDLPHADAGALGALIEEGVRIAGRRTRVSAEFSRIADLLRESCLIARDRGAGAVTRDDVEEALRRREYRRGEIPERIGEALRDGLLMVATAGAARGRVNGLSVLDLGYEAFGKPTRITASVAPGSAGVISIEREAQLSGGVYDKGVLTIGGYLRRRYADIGPLSLTASLAFEQSYSGVDGDSASIAEVVALMSELSGLPVDQAIAITGSINQHGEAQPVGGVNEKLTSFHALCRDRGLDGTHGVVLPASNVEDLMLPPDLVADIAAGRFRVLAVTTVEDALEIALATPMAAVDAAARATLEDFAAALDRTGQGWPGTSGGVPGPS
ncbi:MAG: AAA family ATPase [Thermoleophilia bacterium]